VFQKPVPKSSIFVRMATDDMKGFLGTSICSTELVLHVHQPIQRSVCGLRYHNLLQRHFRSLQEVVSLVVVLWVVSDITSIRKKFDLFIFWQIVKPEQQFVIFRCCKFYLGYFWSSRRPFWASCFCQYAHFYFLYSFLHVTHANPTCKGSYENWWSMMKWLKL
jgi:hypothetical protein